MRSQILALSTLMFVFVIVGFDSAYSWTPLPVKDDPLVRMPGTQPDQGANLEGPNECLKCHAGYNQAVEPGFNWKGTMHAQASRDPIFWACSVVAGQDSIWALGNPNAIDICERCHFPKGWLGGRSDPPNASAMTGADFDGVQCDFCHRMWDPFFEDTYHGIREGNDWTGYWDEAGTLSQIEADKTYNEDMTLATAIRLFSGGNFYINNLPKYSTYYENGSGQYFVGTGQKRASFADANAPHETLYSRYHKSKYFCSTCHDVSNPALANLGLSGLPDQSGGTDLITEQYPATNYFHVERTFAEFMLSAYSQQGGASTNPEFQAHRAPDITWAAKCQDCHLRDVSGPGSEDSTFRPDGSAEHPNSGLPLHDLSGGNAWISHILASLDPNAPVYDPVNVQILDKGPSVLTVDLNAGQSPKVNGVELKAASNRAKEQLRRAATIKNLTYNPNNGAISFTIQNNTGHKLISGFPEGRRMFVNIKVFDENRNQVYQVNPYDYEIGTLKRPPSLGQNEAYVDELVYEVQVKSDLTGEDKTFHFVLATGRYKDNRIPPKGFNIGNAPARLSEPVWHGASAPDYFTPGEYAGGYDDISLSIAPGGAYIEVTLYYQGTSREYMEFLRDEINGTTNTLSSPTPSGEPEAYIIQSDPFFGRLKEWGNTMWDLWYHNHGLDGSGVQVDGIVPFAITRTVWGETQVRITDIYTCDENSHPKTQFEPAEPIQFHMVYDVVGDSSTQYKVRAIINAFGKTYYKTEYRYPGVSYHMVKDRDQGKQIRVDSSIPPGTIETIGYKAKLKDGGALVSQDKATCQITVAAEIPDIEIVNTYTSDHSMVPKTQFRPGDTIFYHIFYDVEGIKWATYTVKGMVKNKKFNRLRQLPLETWLYPDPPEHFVPPGSNYHMTIQDTVPEVADKGQYWVKAKAKMKRHGVVVDTDEEWFSFYVIE